MEHLAIENFRNRLNYREQFDACFAGAFVEEDKEKSNFYERIQGIFRDIKKRLFVPSKSISARWKKDKLEIIVNKIIVPSSDLVFCFAEQYVNSECPEISISQSGEELAMIYRAYELEIPIIYLVRQKEICKDNRYHIINFVTDPEAFKKIESFVKRFYRHL